MGFSCRFSFTRNPLSVNFHEVGMGNCQSPLKFTSPYLSRELAENIWGVPRVKVCRVVVPAQEKVIGVRVMTEAFMYWSCPANWELANCYWTNLVMSTRQQNGGNSCELHGNGWTSMLICTAPILFKQAVYISTSFHSIPNWIRILASETWSIPEKNACFSGLKCSFEPYWGIIMNNSQFCIISHALNVPAISMHSVFNYWVFSLLK